MQDAYDAYNDLTSIQAATATGTNAGCDTASTTNTPYGTEFDDLAYTYGTAGDQTGLQQTETINGTQDSYAYNNLNQLVGVSGGAIYNYAYDANGNLVDRTDPLTGDTLQMAYNAANELCNSSETATPTCSSPAYSYDDAGNLTAAGSSGDSLDYNNRGQTTSITPHSGSAQTLAYNGTGLVQTVIVLSMA